MNPRGGDLSEWVENGERETVTETSRWEWRRVEGTQILDEDLERRRDVRSERLCSILRHRQYGFCWGSGTTVYLKCGVSYRVFQNYVTREGAGEGVGVLNPF